jgi:hypothetical protein
MARALVIARRTLAGVAAFVATLAAASCSLEVGGVLEGGPDATADGTTGDAIAPGDDGGTGDATPDGFVEAGPCPSPGLPLCDVTTCATGEACSPPLAPGWSLVVLHRGAPAACPAAFAPRDGGAVEFQPGVATCGCSCNKVGGSCGTGAATVTFGAVDSNCPSNAAGAPIAPDNGCAALGTVQPGTTVFGFNVSRPTATQPSCVAVGTSSGPSPDGGAARLCEVSDASALCAQHRFCVPTVADKVCIAKSGTETCPAPFVQSVLATDITGARGCGCTCTAAAGSCVGTATIYNGGSSCANGSPIDIPYDGGCVNVTGVAGGNYKFIAISPDASPGGSCSPVATTQNTAAPVNPTTVCCTP